MRRLARLSALIALGLFAAGAAVAGPAMTMALNHSQRVVMSGVIGNVIVGDSTVADVVMIDAHSVIVVGKGYGATQILVLDRGGRALMDARVSVTGGDDGRVTLYRGANPTEYGCAGRCQALTPSGGASSPGGGSPASAPAAPSGPVSATSGFAAAAAALP